MQTYVKVPSSQSSDIILGEPLPIFFVNENAEDSSKRIKMSMKNLRRVFLDPRIINSKIMIVSISGPKRTGKSFFMNICLRYLYKRRLETVLTNQDSKSGFQCGLEMQNTSLTIYIWSEPYIIETYLKNKVAVLVLDFQGSSSNKLLINETLAIQAMLQILSSLQILNVSSQIHENNLQWLAMSSDYSNIAKSQVHHDLENKLIKSNQTLCILIRDWPYPYEFFYGSAGGQQYINRYLSTQHGNLPTQNIVLRKYLDSQFTNISCFLMPHPNSENPRLNNLERSLGEVSNEFHEHVLGFMKNIFATPTLLLKEVCGQPISAKEMLNYIELYFYAVTLTNNPTPHMEFDACSKSHHHLVFDECIHYYNESMKLRHLYSQSANVLLTFHERCKMSTIQKFDDSHKLGLSKYSEIFRIKLDSQIDEEFIQFYAMNPSQPVAITRLLSVIVLSIIMLSAIAVFSRLLVIMNITWVHVYVESFIFISVSILILYCIVTIKQVYSELNINTEMQTTLRDQFLN